MALLPCLSISIFSYLWSTLEILMLAELVTKEQNKNGSYDRFKPPG